MAQRAAGGGRGAPIGAALLLIALSVAAMGPGSVAAATDPPVEPVLPDEPGAFNLTGQSLEGTFVTATVPGGDGPLATDVRIGGAAVLESVSLERWQWQMTNVSRGDFYVTGTSGDLHLHDTPAVSMELDLLEFGVLTIQVSEPGGVVAGEDGSLRVLAEGVTAILWETCVNEDLGFDGLTVTLGPVALECRVYFRVRTANDVLDHGLMEDALVRGELLAEGSMYGWMGDGGWEAVSYGSQTVSFGGSNAGRGFSVARVDGEMAGALKLMFFHVDIPIDVTGTTVVVYLEDVEVTDDELVRQGGQGMERLDNVGDAFAPRAYASGTGGFAVVQSGNATAVVFDLPGPGSYDLLIQVEGPLPDGYIPFVWIPRGGGGAPAEHPQWWVWPLLAVAGLLISRRIYRGVTLKVRAWHWERKR